MLCVHSKMSEIAWQMTVWMTIKVADDSLFFYYFFFIFQRKQSLTFQNLKRQVFFYCEEKNWIKLVGYNLVRRFKG